MICKLPIGLKDMIDGFDNESYYSQTIDGSCCTLVRDAQDPSVVYFTMVFEDTEMNLFIKFKNKIERFILQGFTFP